MICEDRVYPRGCGGASRRASSASGERGLSPRVRGSRFSSSATPSKTGSIPAGAGEPYQDHPWRAAPRVYPRGCGGASAVVDKISLFMGLSPRVRGSLSQGSSGSPRTGSIPAGAGEPYLPVFRLGKWRVYPRGCGGARTEIRAGPRFKGLSPRVRGSLPRVFPGYVPRGSIPRVRGSLPRVFPGYVPRGSIPAGAGEPRPSYTPCSCIQVYPRGCGGAVRGGPKNQANEGLSPRVRGSLRGQIASLVALGSIPAGAGEPCGCFRCRW